jgi:hypothetical protein
MPQGCSRTLPGMVPSPVSSSASYVNFCSSAQAPTFTLGSQFSGWTVFLKGKWDTATFITNYLPLVGFPILYIVGRIAYRVRPVKPLDMDFVTNIAEIEAETYVRWSGSNRCPLLMQAVFFLSYNEPPPKNWGEAFWGYLVGVLSPVYSPGH